MKHNNKKQRTLVEFRQIPGVGKIIAGDFWKLGIRSFDDIRKSDAEQLYESLCKLQNMRVDRCMLFVFRCAIYFVSEQNHKPELLKWWNWKDK